MNHDKAASLTDRLLKSPAGREILAKRLNLNLVEKDDSGELKGAVVAVLTPCLDVPEHDFVQAMRGVYAYTREKNAAVVYEGPSVRGSSIVHWARNYLVAELIKTGNPWTHVLFVDDDMVPPPDALVKLLSHQKDIVGAICTKRQDPPIPNIRWFDDKTCKWQHIYRWPHDQLIEVGGVGTGMMLVSRHALELIAEAYFSCSFEKECYGLPDEKLDYFRDKRLKYFDTEKNAFWFRNLTALNGGHEWGEDMSFCFMARRYCDLKVFCDTSVQPDHIGNYGFGVKDYLAQQEVAIEMAKQRGEVPQKDFVNPWAKEDEPAIQVV